MFGCFVCRLLALDDGEEKGKDSATEKSQDPNAKSEGMYMNLYLYEHYLIICQLFSL